MSRDPQERIIVERGEAGWTYRYASPPTGEDGTVLVGFTCCCNRPICAPNGLTAAEAHRSLPHIDDCCDRPFALHGHKPVDLPPYSGEHATCRKCGSKAAETKFTTQAQQPFGIPRGGYPKEWLHRRCVVCSAEWDEACVAPEPPLFTFGLRNPRELSNRMGRPYETVHAHDPIEAWRALIRLGASAPTGDELVRRAGLTEPWEVVARVNADGRLDDA